MNEQFYINQDPALAQQLTGLALDEIEAVVGRFSASSSRKGQLRGKVLIYVDGTVEIRACFGGKLLWSAETGNEQE